jgi:Acetyl-CoA carboxylase, central region
LHISQHAIALYSVLLFTLIIGFCALFYCAITIIIGDERLPPNITRYGVFAVVNSTDELSQHMTDVLQALPQYNSNQKATDVSPTSSKTSSTGPVNVLHIALLNYSDDTDTSGNSSGAINDEAISSKLSSLLSSHAKDLLQADVRRVTFLVGTKQVYTLHIYTVLLYTVSWLTVLNCSYSMWLLMLKCCSYSMWLLMLKC